MKKNIKIAIKMVLMTISVSCIKECHYNGILSKINLDSITKHVGYRYMDQLLTKKKDGTFYLNNGNKSMINNICHQFLEHYYSSSSNQKDSQTDVPYKNNNTNCSEIDWDSVFLFQPGIIPLARLCYNKKSDSGFSKEQNKILEDLSRCSPIYEFSIDDIHVINNSFIYEINIEDEKYLIRYEDNDKNIFEENKIENINASDKVVAKDSDQSYFKKVVSWVKKLTDEDTKIYDMFNYECYFTNDNNGTKYYALKNKDTLADKLFYFDSRENSKGTINHLTRLNIYMTITEKLIKVNLANYKYCDVKPDTFVYNSNNDINFFSTNTLEKYRCITVTPFFAAPEIDINKFARYFKAYMIKPFTNKTDNSINVVQDEAIDTEESLKSLFDSKKTALGELIEYLDNTYIKNKLKPVLKKIDSLLNKNKSPSGSGKVSQSENSRYLNNILLNLFASIYYQLGTYNFQDEYSLGMTIFYIELNILKMSNAKKIVRNGKYIDLIDHFIHLKSLHSGYNFISESHSYKYERTSVPLIDDDEFIAEVLDMISLLRSTNPEVYKLLTSIIKLIQPNPYERMKLNKAKEIFPNLMSKIKLNI